MTPVCWHQQNQANLTSHGGDRNMCRPTALVHAAKRLTFEWLGDADLSRLCRQQESKFASNMCIGNKKPVAAGLSPWQRCTSPATVCVASSGSFIAGPVIPRPDPEGPTSPAKCRDNHTLAASGSVLSCHGAVAVSASIGVCGNWTRRAAKRS